MSHTRALNPEAAVIAPSDRTHIARGVATAAVGALSVNAGIAWAVGSTNPGGLVIGLTPLQYGPLTVVGVLGATVGWAKIRKSAPRPRAVLRLLVPLLLLLSFVPDLLLLLAGTTRLNVAGLLGMHIAVAAITVPILYRLLPLPHPVSTTIDEPPVHSTLA